MSNFIHVGFIGCGLMAQKHMKIIQHYIPQIKIKAMMDIVEDKAKSAYKEFNADYFTTDLNLLLKDSEIDTVYICTHHDTHVQLGIKAAQAGKNIFMEKPLALTVEECKQMEDTVKSTGIKFMMGFPQRFSELSQKAKELVPRPTMVWGRQIQGRWADTFWAQNSRGGGGNVLSAGCHTMDTICYFSASKPVEIHAEGGSVRHVNKEVIDTMMGVIRFENGSTAAVIIADCAPAGLPEVAYELLGEGHGAFILNFQELWYDSPGGGLGLKAEINLRIPFKGASGIIGKDYGLIQENEAFVRYVLSGESSPCPVEDGTRATLLVLKSFESIRTGKTQEINLS